MQLTNFYDSAHKLPIIFRSEQLRGHQFVIKLPRVDFLNISNPLSICLWSPVIQRFWQYSFQKPHLDTCEPTLEIVSNHSTNSTLYLFLWQVDGPATHFRPPNLLTSQGFRHAHLYLEFLQTALQKLKMSIFGHCLLELSEMRCPNLLASNQCLLYFEGSFGFHVLATKR